MCGRETGRRAAGWFLPLLDMMDALTLSVKKKKLKRSVFIKTRKQLTKGAVIGKRKDMESK